MDINRGIHDAAHPVEGTSPVEDEAQRHLDPITAGGNHPRQMDVTGPNPGAAGERCGESADSAS